jgi:hypothetical protein
MPAPKDYIKIQYPRKCNQCNYISNNPQMWHYHNRTHNPILPDQLCDHGCGQPAHFFNTHGKYTCQKIAQRCPEYVRIHTDRIKQQWARPESDDRKKATADSIRARLHNEESFKRAADSKRKRSGTYSPEKAKEYRHYARFIRGRAQKWANDNGHVLGKQTFHVDHKFSVLDSWNNNLPESIVNHPANLRILEAKLNSSKGSKSSITLEELMGMILAASGKSSDKSNAAAFAAAFCQFCHGTSRTV